MHFALTCVQELEILMWQIYIVCKMWQTFSFVIHVCMAVGLRLVLCWQWCVGGDDGEVSLHLPVPPPRSFDQNLRGGQAQRLPPVAGTSFTSTSIKCTCNIVSFNFNLSFSSCYQSSLVKFQKYQFMLSK